jgi:hypothetical protein
MQQIIPSFIGRKQELRRSMSSKKEPQVSEYVCVTAYGSYRGACWCGFTEPEFLNF